MRTVQALFLFLAAVAVGCGSQPAPEAANAPMNMAEMTPHPARTDRGEKTDRPAAAHQIVIDNFAFAPSELTVPVGAEVTWVNHDDVPHTATSTAKPRAIDSGTLDTDQAYSHVFTTVGEYEYFCAVHPKMTGKVIVK